MADNKYYDVAIIGGGVSGAFAVYKLAEKDPSAKICLIEFGRPPGKRRKQLEGWLGCFPNSNARLYLNDLNEIQNISGIKNATIAEKEVKAILQKSGTLSVARNKEPNDDIKKKLKRNGYELSINNFTQWKPENIHSLSRVIAAHVIDHENIDLMFDTEVLAPQDKKIAVDHKKGQFIINTEYGIIYAKKILLCAGRSGWRFANGLFEHFGLLDNNDYAYFGFRAEMQTSYLENWNNSHCSVSKKNINIGPLSWSGTVIPEDHCDLVISSFRSNEERWASNKASFSIIVKEKFEKAGWQQTERLSKLVYILNDNRIGRIKIKEYLSNPSIYDISLIPEYSWIMPQVKEINKIMPEFIDKAYMNFPDIYTYKQNIKIGKDFSTDFDGLYAAGESAGITGIYAAALSGNIAATNII